MRLNLKNNQRGFTLVEVTIILLVLVILSTIMLPQLGNFNRLARFVKVTEDLGAICASMKKMLDEVMLSGPWSKPGGTTAAPQNPTGLLIGPGTAPNDLVNTSGGEWGLSASGSFAEQPDMGGTTAGQLVTFQVDNLTDHLQINNPGDIGTPDPADRYKNQADDPTVGPFFGWRGPYFDQITSDPWGGRYAVNSFALHSDPSPTTDTSHTTFSSAVVCYSAGPDTLAHTEFNQEQSNGNGFGWESGGDDISVVLSAMGPF